MAMLSIKDYFDFGVHTTHNGSSWQIAIDSDFTHIVDESIADSVNVKTWHSQLKKLDGPGYYKDLDQLYARVRVHIDNTVSPWFVLPVGNQNDQVVIVTDVAGNNTTHNSLEMGLK